MLIVLPLYPNSADGHIYSVNLFEFTKASTFSVFYWTSFLLLIMTGFLKIVLTQLDIHKAEKIMSWCSMGIGTLTVMLLILTRQVYPSILMFALLTIKGIINLKHKEL